MAPVEPAETETPAVENWLRDTVGPAYDALKAAPLDVLTAAEIRTALAQEHRKATARR